MRSMELVKGSQLYSDESFQIYATNDQDLAIMEWADEEACGLSFLLQQILRRHALSTNFVDRLGRGSIVVKRLEPIQLTVIARSSRNDTSLEFVGQTGAVLPKEEACKAPGAKQSRIACMEDAALHVVRSLRAHLAPLGHVDLTLRLTFGLDSVGACVLQVLNPRACDFGTTDYKALYEQLGGAT